jgi:hypothetical protein
LGSPAVPLVTVCVPFTHCQVTTSPTNTFTVSIGVFVLPSALN